MCSADELVEGIELFVVDCFASAAGGTIVILRGRKAKRLHKGIALEIGQCAADGLDFILGACLVGRTTEAVFLMVAVSDKNTCHGNAVIVLGRAETIADAVLGKD